MRLARDSRILNDWQRDAVLALLRVVADGEVMAEQARCRLCEVMEFDPYSTFQQVQGMRPQKGWLTAYDLHSWLLSQPHSMAGTMIDDVATIIAPFLNAHGQLRYEGFLRLVLPKDATHAWLKELALVRGSNVTLQADPDRCPPEVAYRLCQLLETEIDVSRHLKFHRKELQDRYVDFSTIVAFLDRERGDTAAVTGLLSPGSLRYLLVERLQELTTTQCEALLRRLNPNGAYMLPTDELSRLITGRSISVDMPPPLQPPLSTPGVDASYGSYAGHRSPTVAFREPIVGSSGGTWQATPPSIARESIQYYDRSIPRLDPYGVARGVDASRDWSPGRTQPLHNTKYADSPRHSSFGLSSTRAPTSGGRATAEPLTSPRSPRWAAAVTPRREAPFPASTWQVGMRSPQRPSSVPAAPGISRASACAVSPSALPSMRPMTPRETCKASASLGTNMPSPSLGSPIHSLELRNSHRDLVAMRVSNLRIVLKTLVRQAEIDERLEDMKVLLPPGTSLQAVFRTLDRYSKGYIADTDIWQFMQDFHSRTTTFSNLCSLVHEVQLRQPRNQVLTPGQLSLRALGTMLFPSNSQEYAAMRAASSDAEALSILYCLYYSEACPGCGFRVQRDADAAGCPEVTCPNCGTRFRCFIVVGDSGPHESFVLPPSVLYHLHSLIDFAASAAEELEQGRKQLASLMATDVLSLLSETFASFAEGRMYLTLSDLRRAVLSQDLYLSERQFDLLWRRYSPEDAPEVSFTDYVRQLKPRNAGPYYKAYTQ